MKLVEDTDLYKCGIYKTNIFRNCFDKSKYLKKMKEA